MNIIFLLLLTLSTSTFADTALPVIAHQVKQTSESLSFFAVGNSQPYQQVDIQMPTNGIIKKLPYQSGSFIKKGAIVVQQYADLLKVQRKRDQLLINKLASKSKKKNRKNYAFQDAILKLAKTKLQIKQKQYIAPFSGVLGLLQVSKGALITPETIISTINDVSKIRVRFQLAELKLKQIKKGTVIRVSSKYTKQLLGEGKISYIDTQYNKKTRSIMVEAIINNSKGSIKSGQFLDVQVLIKSPQPKVYIPISAIQKQNNNSYVYKIINNHVEKTKVTLGKLKANQVQIISGIKVNERIVARGLAQLKNKVPVTIIDYIN